MARLRIVLPLIFLLATAMAACDFPSGLASLNVMPSMRLAPGFAGSVQTASPAVIAPSALTTHINRPDTIMTQPAPIVSFEEANTQPTDPNGLTLMPVDSLAELAAAVEPLEEPLILAEPAPSGLDPRAALFASGSFKMQMPFQTQKDGTRYEGANCGPAALGMVLGAFGMAHDDMELRVLTHTYQGTGLGGGTALQFMAQVGEDFGLQPLGLYDGEEFHRWTVDDVQAQLAQGHPVIPLVKYRLLPDHTDSTYRWDHYVVIYGMDGDRFLYHDPAYGTAGQGGAHWMTAAQLDAVLGPTLVQRQAVAFAPGDLTPLKVSAL
ncbi:MAG: Peptidase like family [Chloroflexota bacterium]|jgi:hypothetical protein|nr:Peptidase like family [Chloroflexota bacterium]